MCNDGVRTLRLESPIVHLRSLFAQNTEILFRQDVILLPNAFPMRAARTKGVMAPDGDALVAYRAPRFLGQPASRHLPFFGSFG